MLLLAVLAAAGAVHAQDPVGFISLQLPAAEPVLLSLPFAPLNPEAHVVPGSNARVLFWDGDAQAYHDGTNGASLEAGTAFVWQPAGAEEGSLLLCGRLVQEAERTVPLLPALNLIGSPYAAPVAVAPHGSILPGEAIWLDMREHAGTTLSLIRPYSPLLLDGSEWVAITNVSSGSQVPMLWLSCERDAEVDLFYRDLVRTEELNLSYGWRAIATVRDPVWRDSDAATRLREGNLFGRLYLAAAAEADADGDGLSDAREKLIYRTNPELADSDGDGMTDGAEAAGGLDPLVADAEGDADGDGIDNGDELARGTDPRDPSSRSIMLYVDGSRGDDSNRAAASDPVRTINEALRRTRPGDTVVVASGNYPEDIDDSRLGINLVLGDVNISK